MHRTEIKILWRKFRKAIFFYVYICINWRLVYRVKAKHKRKGAEKNKCEILTHRG